MFELLLKGGTVVNHARQNMQSRAIDYLIRLILINFTQTRDASAMDADIHACLTVLIDDRSAF